MTQDQGPFKAKVCKRRNLTPDEVIRLIKSEREAEISLFGTTKSLPPSAEQAFQLVKESLQTLRSVVGSNHWDREWRIPEMVIGDSVDASEMMSADFSFIQQRIKQSPRRWMEPNKNLLIWLDSLYQEISEVALRYTTLPSFDQRTRVELSAKVIPTSADRSRLQKEISRARSQAGVRQPYKLLNWQAGKRRINNRRSSRQRGNKSSRNKPNI